LLAVSLIQLIGRLWGHVDKKRHKHFVLLAVLLIITSLTEVVSIGAVLPFLAVLAAPEKVFGHAFAQPFIGMFGFTEARQLLLPIAVAFASTALLSGGMRLLLLIVQTRLSYAIGADVSNSIFKRTLYQPYSVHIARNSSDIIAGISTKANTVVGYAVLPIINIAISAMMTVSILFLLVAVEPSLALSAFTGFAVLYLVVMFIVRRRIATCSSQLNIYVNRVIKVLQEGLGGIRDVLLDGTQAVFCKLFRETDKRLRRSSADLQIISVSPRLVIESLGMVLIAAVACFYVEQSDEVSGAIPMLGMLALGAQRLLPVVQQAFQSWAALRGGMDTLIETLDLLDQPLPEYLDQPIPAPLAFERAIELVNIEFQYAKSLPFILKGVSFIIPKGSRIGIVGATGSGKSTLLDLLMGLLPPSDGLLKVDGQEVSRENIVSWQQHIAHVPQAIFLPDSSIAEAIAFGIPRDEINFERVREAARKAHIAELIESWGEKYDTRVGERGVRLSGGQRQRIGIARALYKNADVVVFDEATSALDNDTENSVMESIDSLDANLTVIIVAHRLSTLKGCSQVIELIDGKVSRVGSYSDIVN
jgi:ABC-type bacteriocin/lantibiotic exporter with double-glycine peptidase domain